MEVANFTEHENQKTFRELFCSPEITAKFPNELIFLSALNISLSITAFLGNTLILIALKKETSLHPSSKVLFRSLATTDLCVGIAAEPLAVVYLMSVVNKRWDACYYAHLMNFATAARYFMHSVFFHTDCNKRGQTSRPAIGAKIQTYCNITKSIYSRNRNMGFLHLLRIKQLLESSSIFLGFLHCFIFMSSHHNFLLHEDFLHLTSSLTWYSKWRFPRTTDASNSTKHCSIQKGSV